MRDEGYFIVVRGRTITVIGETTAGLNDDLSRGPVTTLESQKQQVRTLAAYKVNICSPYIESNFAYASTPLSAPPQEAMTKEEIAELVAFAQRYHLTIVAE